MSPEVELTNELEAWWLPLDLHDAHLRTLKREDNRDAYAIC